MKRKTASQILKEANPDLSVIPGGVHHRKRREKAIKLDEVSRIELPGYIPRQMNDKDWDDAGGLTCPRCHQDCVRLVPIGLTGRVKMCPDCIERRRRLIAFKSRLIDNKRNAAMANRK